MRRLKIILYFSFYPSLFLLSFLPRPFHQTQSPFDSSRKYVLSLSFFLIKFLVISIELEAIFFYVHEAFPLCFSLFQILKAYEVIELEAIFCVCA